MDEDRVVAIGFLTRRDVEALGPGYTRAVPVEQERILADVLSRLSDVRATPLYHGVLLMPRGAREGRREVSDGA